MLSSGMPFFKSRREVALRIVGEESTDNRIENAVRSNRARHLPRFCQRVIFCIIPGIVALIRCRVPHQIGCALKPRNLALTFFSCISSLKYLARDVCSLRSPSSRSQRVAKRAIDTRGNYHGTRSDDGQEDTLVSESSVPVLATRLSSQAESTTSHLQTTLASRKQAELLLAIPNLEGFGTENTPLGPVNLDRAARPGPEKLDPSDRPDPPTRPGPENTAPQPGVELHAIIGNCASYYESSPTIHDESIQKKPMIKKGTGAVVTSNFHSLHAWEQRKEVMIQRSFSTQ